MVTTHAQFNPQHDNADILIAPQHIFYKVYLFSSLHIRMAVRPSGTVVQGFESTVVTFLTPINILSADAELNCGCRDAAACGVLNDRLPGPGLLCYCIVHAGTVLLSVVFVVKIPYSMDAIPASYFYLLYPLMTTSVLHERDFAYAYQPRNCHACMLNLHIVNHLPFSIL